MSIAYFDELVALDDHRDSSVDTGENQANGGAFLDER